MNPRQIGLGLTLLILAALAAPADAGPKPPGGGGALERLCKVVDCGRPLPPAPPPYISSWSSPCGLSGVSGCVAPYGVISILGNGFGYSSPGKAQLCGGLPGQSGCVDLQLVPNQWFDGFIMATVPFIEGVPDHRVNLYVTRADGVRSQPVLDIPFRALRDLQRVSANRVAVTTCALSGTCQLQNAGTASAGGQVVVGGSWIWASHQGSSVAIHGTQGTDRYTIGPLQNGWVLHSFSTSYGGCCAPSVDYFNPGATTANLAVRWQLGGSFGFVGQVGFYIVDVYITGPLGVGF